MTKVSRPIAEMSPKTARAAEKLRKQWESEKQQINEKALKETKAKIHQWIADNAKHRVAIPEKKSIRLFNQNEDSALMSGKVKKFAHQLFAKKSNP